MTPHFQLCHGGTDSANNWPSGWHWHWVFPPNGEIASGCELMSAGCDRMLSDCMDDFFGKDVISQLDPWKLWDFCRLWQLRCLEAIPNARQHSFQTVALLQSGQSLPELLGIMRCYRLSFIELSRLRLIA